MRRRKDVLRDCCRFPLPNISLHIRGVRYLSVDEVLIKRIQDSVKWQVQTAATVEFGNKDKA